MSAAGGAAQPVALSWSGGKDSALALERLRADPRFVVTGLLTTVTTDHDRISIHGVRRDLLHAQAHALGLPLQEVPIPAACSNAEYEAAFGAALADLPRSMPGVARIAFGDIRLGDVRRYRERLVESAGFDALFPLWHEPTDRLAEAVLGLGIVARLVCVDTHALDAAFAGRVYDSQLLRDLPDGVDPCGENGEFHTFVSDAPAFSGPVRYEVGGVVLRDDRFAYCDLGWPLPE